MYCIHCGTQLPEEAQFCFKCGKPLSIPAGVAPPQSLAPAAIGNVLPENHPFTSLFKESMKFFRLPYGSQAFMEMNDQYKKAVACVQKALHDPSEVWREEPFFGFIDIFSDVTGNIRDISRKYKIEDGQTYDRDERKNQIMTAGVIWNLLGTISSRELLTEDLWRYAAVGFTDQQILQIDEYPTMKEYVIGRIAFAVGQCIDKTGGWTPELRGMVDRVARQIGPNLARGLNLDRYRPASPATPSATPTSPRQQISPSSDHNPSGRPAPQGGEPAWEYCEVEAEAHYGGAGGLISGMFANTFGFFGSRFIATATGPGGRYQAAASSGFKHRGLNDWEGKEFGQEALDEIVSSLVRDGWEPLPKGYGWYSQRFRRQVRK